MRGCGIDRSECGTRRDEMGCDESRVRGLVLGMGMDV